MDFPTADRSISGCRASVTWRSDTTDELSGDVITVSDDERGMGKPYAASPSEQQAEDDQARVRDFEYVWTIYFAVRKILIEEEYVPDQFAARQEWANSATNTNTSASRPVSANLDP